MDSTLGRRVAARMLTGPAGSPDVELTTQAGRTEMGRMVYLTIYRGGRKVVYEIPLEEWSRLNRDATRTP